MANRKGTKRTSVKASPIKSIENNIKQAVAIDDEIQRVQQAKAKAEQIAQQKAQQQASQLQAQLNQNNSVNQNDIKNIAGNIENNISQLGRKLVTANKVNNEPEYKIPTSEPTTFDMMSTTNMLNAMSDEEYAQYMAQNKPEVENFYNNVNEETTNKTDGKDLLTLLGETAANTGIGAVNTVKNIKNGVIDASTDIGHYDGTILDYIYMMNNPTAALMTVGSQALAQNNGVDVDANFNKQLAYNQQLAKDTDAPFDWAAGKMANDWTNDETGQFWQSIGNNLVTAGVGLATGGLGFGTGAATAASLGAMGTGVYGGDTQQALDEGYNFKNASNYGLLDAGKEVGTELLSPGIPGLNKVNLLGEGAEEMLGAAVDPLVQLALQDDVSLGDVGNAALAGISPDNWGNIASAGAQGVLSALVLDGLTGGNSIKAIPGEIQNSIASDRATINNFINNDVYNQNVKAINDTIDMYQDVNTTEAKAMYQEALTQKLDIAKQYATAENLASNDKNIKIAAQRANADIIEQTAKQYNVNISEKSLNDIAKISNVLNTPMEFTDIALPENAEGMFDPTTNSIKIANKTTNPVLAVLGHETYHGIEETTSGQEYSQIVQQMADNGTLNTKNTLDIAKEVQEYYQTEDANTVNSETTAILTQKLLGNDKAIHQLALESSPSLIDNFKGLMNNIATKLTGTSATKQIAHAQDIFTKGVKEAANIQNTNTNIEESRGVSAEADNKAAQLNIIKANNIMLDDYHTGIRTVDDIKTWEEAMQDDESFVYGDFDINDAKAALKKGKITVYSSYPIKQGTFVSTSKNMATDYAGGDSSDVYSKTVKLNDVAWINGDEGQFASVKKEPKYEDFYRPDGSIKDLQAIHNINEENLSKALDLGALPMPSIAITKDNLGHKGFGDISLVFDKNTIDPTNNKNNKIYDRDSWTATYPSIDYEINTDITKKATKEVKSILGKEIAKDIGLSDNNFEMMLKTGLYNNRGNIYNTLEENNALRYAFLKEKGVNVDIPYIESDTPLLENGEEVKTVDKDRLEYNLGKSINSNYDEYKNWVLDKFDGVIKNKGIRVKGYDKTTDAQKPFEQTHIEENPENVLEYMKNPDNYSTDYRKINYNDIIQRTQNPYNSMQEVIDDRDKIKIDTTKQREILQEIVRNEMFDIARDKASKTSTNNENLFGDKMEIVEKLYKATYNEMRNSNNASEFMNNVNNGNYGIKIDNSEARSIFQLKENIAKMPSPYFEAKPERIVNFDEIKKAVVPSDSRYDNIVERLEEKGIDVSRYDTYKEGDRQEKINERYDLKFSKGVSAETKKYSKYSNIELNKNVKNYKSIREKFMDDTFGRNEDSFNRLTNEATVEILENGDISDETKEMIINKAYNEGGELIENDVVSSIKSFMSGKTFKVEKGAYKDAGYDSAVKMNNDFAKYGIRFSQEKGESLDQTFSEMFDSNIGIDEVYPREQIPYLRNILASDKIIDRMAAYGTKEQLTDYINGRLETFKKDVLSANKESNNKQDNKEVNSKKSIAKILSGDDVVETEKTERENGNIMTPEEYATFVENQGGDVNNKWGGKQPELVAQSIGKDISFAKSRAKSTYNNIRNLAERGRDYTALSKTVDQMGDVIANGDKELQKAWRETISQPMYEATGGYSFDVAADLENVYDTLVKKLGIKKGSKESQGLFWFSEQAKPTGNGGETTPYTLVDLKRDFPNSWENIVEGEKFARDFYEDKFEKINNALESIYPKEKLDELIAKKRNELNFDIEKTNALIDKLQNEDYVDNERIENLKKDVAKKSEDYNNAEKDITHNKRLLHRKNYMRHIQENVTAQSIIDILKGKTNINIDNNVAGVSDDTHPYTAWSSILQERKGGSYNDDAISSILAYIPEANYKINIDPYTAYLRGVTQEYINASNEAEAHNGRTIRYLSNLANDLSRKTNPIDRALLNINNGRDYLQLLKKVNSRIKANAVLGNLNSAVSQFYNLPNAVAVMGDKGGAKSSIDWTKGMVTMTQDMTKPYQEKIISMSPFMAQRYGIDDVMSKFDDKVIQTPRKTAKWLMTFGDKVVAQQTWYAAYEQAQRLNVDNPVFYADDITRRSVAGRGIGEVPLAQKSEIVKLVAPFQVEVNNQWQVLKHLATGGDNKKLLSGMLGMLAMATVSWLMNNVNESVTGRRVGFDPFDAILSARDENASISGRLVGNVLSNIPGGSYIRTAFGNDTAVSNWLGNEDPTRYGTGNMGIQAIAEPFIDMVTGTPYKASKLFNFALPFGGKQAERTYNYLADKGVVPDVTLFGSDLLSADTKEGAYNAKGDRLKYTIDDDILNNIRGAIFGSSATTQGQDFSNAYDSGKVPTLGTNQTKYYEALGGGYDVYQAIQETRQTEKHVDNNGNTISSSKAAEVRKTLEDAGLYDDVMEKINSGELPDDTLGLNKTVEGWSQEEFNNFYDSLTDYEQGKTDTIETPKKYSSSEQSTINTLSNYGISDDVASSIVKANDNYTKNVVNTDTGESIKNSKAALTRQQMIEDGSYQQVVDFLNSDENINSDDPLKPSDFGLNKTVVNMSDEEYHELLKEINKYYSEDKKETGSINQDTDYTRFFDQFIA